MKIKKAKTTMKKTKTTMKKTKKSVMKKKKQLKDVTTDEFFNQSFEDEINIIDNDNQGNNI